MTSSPCSVSAARVAKSSSGAFQRTETTSTDSDPASRSSGSSISSTLRNRAAATTLGYWGAMSDLGAIATAIITPFDADLCGEQAAFVDLMKHLAANGNDGFVVAGTTGEAATLDDDEHLRLIELAVA